ncbi:DUF3306 domain-containing protein [Sulfitobacter sp. BDSS02]|nr:DUF3306 domain-containing protein [Sulfitobacter sp. BDSS02]MBR9849218.1 DUF3306 domain-containing protein [Paracoccaceae bacterium]
MTARKDFWSRRKAAVRAEESAAQVMTEAQIREGVVAEQDDATLLAELGLPDPETLQAGDDIRAFMAKAVPEHLRRMALRRLWKVNPVLANVDGLAEYGEDFTDSATVVENLQTTYQVGKGMLSHIKAMARDADLEEIEETPEELVAETEAEPEPEPAPAVQAETIARPAEVVEDRRPRRMRFRFTEATPQDTRVESA